MANWIKGKIYAINSTLWKYLSTPLDPCNGSSPCPKGENIVFNINFLSLLIIYSDCPTD